MNLSKPVKYIIIPFSILIGFGLLYFYSSLNPSEHDFFPKCYFNALTGFHCPGCGTQRALHDFFNFRIVEGLKHNLLIGLAFIVIVYQIYMYIRASFYHKKDNNLLYHSKTPWIILSIILVFWIARNLPFHPFEVLAP